MSEADVRFAEMTDDGHELSVRTARIRASMLESGPLQICDLFIAETFLGNKNTCLTVGNVCKSLKKITSAMKYCYGVLLSKLRMNSRHSHRCAPRGCSDPYCKKDRYFRSFIRQLCCVWGPITVTSSSVRCCLPPQIFSRPYIDALRDNSDGIGIWSTTQEVSSRELSNNPCPALPRTLIDFRD